MGEIPKDDLRAVVSRDENVLLLGDYLSLDKSFVPGDRGFELHSNQIVNADGEVMIAMEVDFPFPGHRKGPN